MTTRNAEAARRYRERISSGRPSPRNKRHGETRVLTCDEWLHADRILALGGVHDVEDTGNTKHRTRVRRELADLVAAGLVERRLDPDGYGWSYRRAPGAEW